MRGYPFLLAVLYIWLTMLVAVALACAWAAWDFKNNDIKVTWVLELVRSFKLLFVQLLDVAGMTLLFIPLGCQYYGTDVQQRGQLSVLPDVCK